MGETVSTNLASRRTLRAFVLCLLSLFAVLPALTETLPAVVLRKRPLLTPIEAIGSDLAPTVKVRVNVDSAGRVAEVEVESITPSTDFDRFYADAVQSNISEWRFAPALKDGAPVATTLIWSLEFQPATNGSDEFDFVAPARNSDGQFDDMIDPGLARLISHAPADHSRVLQIFTLPVEQQRQHLNKLVEIAEQQIDAEQRKTHAGGGFGVVTDHNDENAAKIVWNDLAAVFSLLTDTFRASVPLTDSGVPIIFYLYRTRAQYEAFLSSAHGIKDTSGYFCPPGLIAIHAERANREVLRSTLIHEAVHAFLYRHVIPAGRHLPRWLDEGYASYIGDSRITKRGLVPGKRKVTQFYTSQGMIWRGRTLAQLNIDTVKQKIKRGEALPVASILGASRETFYGDAMQLYYPQSWILVHMLCHGESGWSTEQFPNLLLLVAEGYPPKDAVEQIYETTIPELEKRYRDYVRHF